MRFEEVVRVHERARLDRGVLGRFLLLVIVVNHLVNPVSLDRGGWASGFDRVRFRIVCTWVRRGIPLLGTRYRHFVLCVGVQKEFSEFPISFIHFATGFSLWLNEVGVFAWARYIHQFVFQVLVKISLRCGSHCISNMDNLSLCIFGIVIGRSSWIWSLPRFSLQLFISIHISAPMIWLKLQTFIAKLWIRTFCDSIRESS